MRLSFKIILIIWLVLLVILAGVVLSAYSKLKPEALIGAMREQVERNYPGSKLTVGNVDYRLSLDFKVNVTDIQLQRNETKLASVGGVEIKIPWWLFLSNKGTTQININDLDILLDQPKVGKVLSDTSISNGDNQKIKVDINIPHYLLRAKYTLRAKGISVRDSKDLSRKIIISKFLVREFQLGKNSAFEMTIPIEVNHNKAKYDSELWLFGDVTPKSRHWSLNYRGEFKTRDAAEKFQLEDVTIDGKAEINLDHFKVISDMNFLSEKDNIGSGKIVINKEAFKANIEFSKFPLSYLGIIYEEIKNPFLPELEGHARGSVAFEKDYGTDQSVLNSKVSFDGILSLGEISYAGKWNLLFDNAKWETSFITPNGEVSFFRRSIIDFETGGLIQYNEEIGFSGIDFAKGVAPVKGLGELRVESNNKYYVSTASFKGCLVGEEKINGQIKFGRSPDLSFYQVDLLQGQSKLRLAFQHKGSDEQIETEMTTFPWNGYRILEPYFNASSGKLDGKLQGKFSDSWKGGEWLLNLKVSELQNPSGELIQLFKKALLPYNLILNENFTANVEIRKNKIDIKALTLEGAAPAKISGSLQPTGKGSFLTLTYPKNKRWKPVKKELDTVDL